MTMKDLAQRIGVSESAISQYENGKRQPGYETLIELSKIFDVSTDFLLGVEESAQPNFSDADLDLIKIYKAAKQSDKEHINALIKAIDKFLKVDE